MGKVDDGGFTIGDSKNGHLRHKSVALTVISKNGRRARPVRPAVLLIHLRLRDGAQLEAAVVVEQPGFGQLKLAAAQQV